VTAPTRRLVGIAAVCDVVAVLVFVALGRRSHDEGGNVVTGALSVAAPFLIALAVGWAAARAWRAPMAWRTALVVWPLTVAVGMVLRRFVFDRSTATSFIVVATLATGVLLLGWRLVARRIRGCW
jgi:hypothetical protein